MTRRSALAFLLAVAFVATAQKNAYTPDPNWQAPADAVARPNPLADKKDLAAGGRKLFLRNCAECHGDDGRGVKKNAADLQLPVVQQQSDGALYWKVTNGNPRRGMPSFSGIPDLQRWQIVLHLRTLAAQVPSSK